MFIVVVYIYNIVLTLIIEWKRCPKLGNNMAPIVFYSNKRLVSALDHSI